MKCGAVSQAKKNTKPVTMKNNTNSVVLSLRLTKKLATLWRKAAKAENKTLAEFTRDTMQEKIDGVKHNLIKEDFIKRYNNQKDQVIDQYHFQKDLAEKRANTIFWLKVILCISILGNIFLIINK